MDREPQSAGLASLYEDIARRMPVGLYVYQLERRDDDRSLRLLVSNRSAMGQTGLAEDEVVGRLIDEVFPGLRQQGIPQAFADVVRTGQGRSWGEGVYGDSRRGERAYSFQAFALPNACVGVTFEDITERREAERMRERLAGALEAQNLHLRELDRIKSLLLDQVSHELRTPLTSVMGFTELLEDEIGGPLTEGQASFVIQIRRSTSRLLHLVDDLLDDARLEAGTFMVQLAPGDLGDKAHEIIESIRPQADEAGIRLAVDMPDGALPARIDSPRIGQVLLNLLGNALKFTPIGGLITVRVRREPSLWRCEVQDTGPGIAPQDVSRLFQRFIQLEAGARRGGTGLGLAIAKAIVEAHGGAIGVKSTLGEGSTFWFTLPRE